MMLLDRRQGALKHERVGAGRFRNTAISHETARFDAHYSPAPACIACQRKIENPHCSRANDHQGHAHADPISPLIARLCFDQSQQGRQCKEKWRKRRAHANGKQAAEYKHDNLVQQDEFRTVVWWTHGDPQDGWSI